MIDHTRDQATVLHVIDKLTMDGSNPSSCARLFADWAEAHDRDRFRLEFCNLQRDAGAAYLEDRGHVVHTIERGKISPVVGGALAGLIRRARADIVHLHGYSAANFGRVAGRLTRTPTVVQEHALLAVLPHQFVADWLLRHATDAAVAVSRAVKEFMIRSRSIPAGRIRVIHNGVKLDDFRDVDPVRVRELRRRLGLRADSRVVGTVTRLREEKGNRFFIDAAGRIAGELPGVDFLVVGDGPERAELEHQAAGLGLDGRLVFAGHLDDIPAALALMDVAVIASIREGLSLAVIEAMAAGMPIVATRVGGILELIRHEDTAITVPPADPAALAQAIGLLLNAPRSAGVLARRARERSRAFSIESNVRGLENVYDSLLLAQRRRRRH